MYVYKQRTKINLLLIFSKAFILIVSSVPIFLLRLQSSYTLDTTSMDSEQQQDQDQSLTNTLSGTCTLIEI